MLIKKILFLLILSALVSFYSVNAATTTLEKPSLRWHCLQNVRCSDPGVNCGDGVAGHRVQLKTKNGDLPDKLASTTIFVCVSTPQGNVCTSQNGTLDMNTVGYNGLSKLSQLVSYEAQGVYKPKSTLKLSDTEIASIKTNASGKLVLNNQSMEGMEIQDYTPQNLARKWLALNIGTTIKIETGKGGQQQGTFTFEGALSKCLAISWDPYGIVFDSKSLEPIAGVNVALTKKRTDGTFSLALGEDAPSILNPVLTVEDGAFEFYVPDGTYRLDIGASNNFTFPNVASKLNANYSKIYSEIYRGEDIIEKGGIQHRDVPLDSKGLPYTSAIKVLSYSTMLDKGAGIFLIQGQVSHPLAIIKIYGKKPTTDGKNIYVKTRLLTTLRANKLGQFDIRYNLSKLKPTEVVGDIDFIKPDYNNLASGVGDETKKAVFSVEPILNYVEGYAYDDFGKPLTNATVGVYLNQAVKSIYETKTDENGFYKISSEYLPPMSFGLRYVQLNGKSYTVPATKFIAENSRYIIEQKEKIYSYKDINGNIIEPTINIAKVGENNLTTTTKKTSSLNNTSSIMLVIALILISVGIVGIILAIYFMKKHQQQ